MNLTKTMIARWGTGMAALALGISVLGSPPPEKVMKDLKHLEHDPLFQEMARALEVGDTDTAYVLVNRLLAKDYFSRGIKAAAEGDFAGAAADFERVLAIDPEHHRARAELARTYFSMGEFVRSRSEFEQVLAAEPPDTVKDNIQRFLDRMEPGVAPRNWAVRVSAGALYDDNVNFGPVSDVIKVAPLLLGTTTIDRLGVTGDSQPEDSFGAYGYISASSQKDLGDQGAWMLFGEASYYQTWLDTASDFEIQYVGLKAGPRHAGRHHLVDAPLKYEHIHRGSDSLVDIYGTTPSMVYAHSQDWHWTTGTTLEYRDYNEFDALDSLYLKAGESVTHFFGNRRQSVAAGLSGFYEDADDDAFSDLGFETFLAGQFFLPWGLSATLKAQYRREWYDEREELAPESREDDEYQLEAQLNKRLTERWSLTSSYQFTRNESTFELHEYERNFVTLGVQGNL